jgi:hypothetical protein
MEDKLRGTGRTTRMIKEAIRLSGKGHAVTVIGHDWQHARMLQSMLDSLDPSGSYDIKIERADDLPQFDWRLLKASGAAPNERFLVDHWTIESRYRVMLEMLRQFDSEE